MARKIGFIGLGIMGSHMAANLVRAGYDVSGYDVVPASVEKLLQAGGKPAPTIAEAVAGAEVVITMLPDSPQVAEVVLGAGGVLESAPAGLLLIDMSSIAPETSLEVARVGAEHGVQVLDAPVSGGEQGAIKASLSIMVGGEADVFETARPIFEDLGRTIVHVGGHGAGQTVKAANQLMVAGIISLVSEAIVLLEASGVDGERGLEVLAGGLAGNRILDLKASTMLGREFAPGFRIDLHHKDMGIALSAARAAGVALPVTGLVAQLVSAARAMGHGSLDHSALLKVVEELSGRNT
ncbi:2-hydroxy-3-oxopropionate reductase [Kribbella italica]|uniref:2-hydroxy-3-oxopropionate reductase n=1 Tax=Kribbella italica TaxID=1540520 RepID=A0A7W9J127_9ACTN|nr:2-hydroxy-3-oxopropionate reductase [Kribbella italica]MBB5833349.1 2-hydroxy-3-oxopropionate reductase [Kribbella italica]